jgi:hypothetical protein
VLAAYTPLSEVLAVVGEESVAVFPQSRDCAPNNLITLQPKRAGGSDPNRLPVSETRERNRFHRASAPAICKGAIVDDHTGTDVDSVV